MRSRTGDGECRPLLFRGVSLYKRVKIAYNTKKEVGDVGIAFIQDKLEIKFLILYIVSRLTEPVDGADLQDMTMCDEGIDYFDYAECLGDLVKTEHLRVTEDGQYIITEKGRRNSGICESSLPYSVRQLSDRHIAAWNKAAVRRQQVQGRVTPRETGRSPWSCGCGTMWIA